MGVLGVAVLEVMVIAIPTWDLGKKHLALASSVAVTCEMVSNINMLKHYQILRLVIIE